MAVRGAYVAGQDRWLVTPWPDTAGVSDVVRHFLMAYAWRLQAETGTARLLAYFTGYAAALARTQTQRHDELLDAVATCVRVLSERQPVPVTVG